MTGIVCSMLGIKPAGVTGRTAKTITPFGNAQVDNAQSQFSGTSAYFDGTGDYLKVAGNAAIGTGDFTVEFWLRKNRSGTQESLVDFRGSGDGGPWFVHAGGPNQVYYYNGGFQLGHQTTLSTGVWYHIAFVRASGVVRIYLNGVQSTGSYTDNTNFSNSRDWYIGYDPFGEALWYLQGWIDEVRVSNIARYTTGFTPTTTPFTNDTNTLLLLHMNGNDGSTTFTDDVGTRSQKNVFVGGNAQVDTAQSKFGGASALFDGAGDYLGIRPNSDFARGTGNWTVEYWIRHSTQAACCHFDTRSGSSDNGMTLYYTGTALTYYTGGGIQITGPSLANNTWYHVALVRNGNEHKLYINGTQSGSTWTNSHSITSIATTVSVGAASDTLGNLGTPGWIDEFRVSNTARYTANFTAPTAAFTNDADTLLLIHADGTDASTTFTDDNS